LRKVVEGIDAEDPIKVTSGERESLRYPPYKGPIGQSSSGLQKHFYSWIDPYGNEFMIG
jgi:hypothetical protein